MIQTLLILASPQNSQQPPSTLPSSVKPQMATERIILATDPQNSRLIQFRGAIGTHWQAYDLTVHGLPISGSSGNSAAVDSQGRIHVIYRNTLFRMDDISGTNLASKTLINIPIVPSAQKVAFGNNGQMYLAYKGKIVAYKDFNTFPTPLWTANTSIQLCYDLHVDSDGTVLITGNSGNVNNGVSPNFNLEEINSNGVLTKFVPPTNYIPTPTSASSIYGVTRDDLGRIYFVDPSTPGIWRMENISGLNLQKVGNGDQLRNCTWFGKKMYTCDTGGQSNNHYIGEFSWPSITTMQKVGNYGSGTGQFKRIDDIVVFERRIRPIQE